MHRDRRDVENIKNILDLWLPTMWNPDTVITNISSGLQATTEMTNDIIDIKQRGEIARDSFINRFTVEGTKESYYDPIKHQDVKLFKPSKSERKSIIAEDESQSLTEILVLYDEKKLNLKIIS